MVAAAIIGLGGWAWEPAYRWVTTERVYFEESARGAPIRGWGHVKRWTRTRVEHGPAIAWYVSTGLKAGEGLWRNGDVIRKTEWELDGSVGDQMWSTLSGTSKIEVRPWRWAVTDQAAPSAPGWILDEKQWQAALDAQE